MENFENTNELPRLTREEFTVIANAKNPAKNLEVLEFMKTHGFSFEPGTVAKVKVDGEDVYFVTDLADFGTVLEEHTIAERGLE